MAIKNKNIMFNLVENLNENKMNEIQKFKKSNLKEANVSNIDESSSNKSYEDKIRNAFDKENEVYNLQFNGNDETQFNANSPDELIELWIDFCKEEKIDPNCLDNVEFGVEECDKNLKESIEMTGSDMTIGDFYQDSVDKLKANTLEKDMVDVYDTDIDYEGPTWVIGSDLTDEGKQAFRDFLSLNIEKFIDDGDRYVLYVNTDDNIDIIDNFLQAQAGNISESLYDKYFIDIDETMNEDAPIDEPSPEDFEDDRKNILIAKKDELEARLGDILQSIKDKQMDTDEFRKLSREAAELDSQIMDIDNQIRGVYECDKSGKLTEEDGLPDITYLLEDYEWKIDVVTKENLGSDYSYFTLVKTPEDALRFNYHSDYWGTADAYQAMAEEVVNAFAPFVDKNVVISFDDGDVKAKVLGILIDRQYNDLEHMKLLIEDLGEVNESINESELFDMSVYSDLEDVNVDDLKRLQDYAVKKTKELVNHIVYWAPYSGIAENILRDMINTINESLPNISESVDEPIDESDEDVKKGIVDQLVATGMTKEQAEQTANGICNIFKNKVGSNQVVSESVKPITEASITEKNLLKSQGNVYMFECKGNPKFTHIVGENYDESENTLENVETYNNKEDADKDYLGRCDIKSEGEFTEMEPKV